MWNWLESLFSKKSENDQHKYISLGWVNLYNTEGGKYRLSGGHTYKTKGLAKKVLKEGTVSEYIETVEIFIKGE